MEHRELEWDARTGKQQPKCHNRPKTARRQRHLDVPGIPGHRGIAGRCRTKLVFTFRHRVAPSIDRPKGQLNEGSV
jgi:hypothetical protein